MVVIRQLLQNLRKSSSLMTYTKIKMWAPKSPYSALTRLISAPEML